MLAGGGLAGIAWETGILRGIADESPATAEALLGSDVLVGTSAGSTVAAQLGSGLGLDALFDRQIDSVVDRAEPERRHRRDHRAVPHRDGAARLDEPRSCRGSARSRCRRETVSEAVRRNVIEHRLPSHDWPDRMLRITAIDTATGELVAFDRHIGRRPGRRRRRQLRGARRSGRR